MSIFNESLYYQYWISVYHSCVYLMGNDLQPRGVDQVGAGAFFNMFGAIILANLFGEFTDLVRILKQRDIILNEKMTTAKTAMAAINFSFEEQNAIAAFISTSDESMNF